MTNNPKFRSIYLTLLAAAGLAVSTASSQAQSASATISGVAFGGGYNYTIDLLNTGGTVLDSFWYAWTLSGNNLAVNPSSAGNSLGWVNVLDANSIQWIGGAPLLPTQTGVFTFFSPEPPAAITTPPSGLSVAYVGGISITEGISGVSTPVFDPVLVASPEPSSIAMLAFGSLGLLAGGWRKLRAQH